MAFVSGIAPGIWHPRAPPLSETFPLTFLGHRSLRAAQWHQLAKQALRDPEGTRHQQTTVVLLGEGSVEITREQTDLDHISEAQAQALQHLWSPDLGSSWDTGNTPSTASLRQDPLPPWTSVLLPTKWDNKNLVGLLRGVNKTQENPLTTNHLLSEEADYSNNSMAKPQRQKRKVLTFNQVVFCWRNQRSRQVLVIEPRGWISQSQVLIMEINVLWQNGLLLWVTEVVCLSRPRALLGLVWRCAHSNKKRAVIGSHSHPGGLIFFPDSPQLLEQQVINKTRQGLLLHLCSPFSRIFSCIKSFLLHAHLCCWFRITQVKYFKRKIK